MVTDIVSRAVSEFVEDVIGALPEIMAGIVFLVVAGAIIKLLMTVVRFTLERTLPEEDDVYRQFVSTLVLVFLSFGAGLSFLSIVGLDGIAASLGTATGFVALGVAYALSGMIADAVAGVYLLRDPDFMPGDTVDVGGTVGRVESIELRKTRLNVEGDTVVRANAEIESGWTRLDDARERADATAETSGESPSEASIATPSPSGIGGPVESDADTPSPSHDDPESEGEDDAATATEDDAMAESGDDPEAESEDESR